MGTWDLALATAYGAVHDSCLLQVFFSRDGRRAQLVIDGLKAQDATMATAGQFLARAPFYVGGVPPRTAKAHVRVRLLARHTLWGGQLERAPARQD